MAFVISFGAYFGKQLFFFFWLVSFKMCDEAVRGERQITKGIVAIEKGWEKKLLEKDHAFFFFFAVLCITELSQHAHPLICGFTHNHATFPTRLTNGFHTELPGSQSSKSPSQKPLHAQEHSRIVGNHRSIKDNLCFQTETSKRLFKTVLRCVKREKKNHKFSSVVCFAAAL